MSLWKKLKASLESRKAATIKEETKFQEDCIYKAKEAKRKEEDELREKHFHDITEKTQVKEKIQETENLFSDISDEIVPDNLDGTSGSASACNYLRLKENVSVVEAVEKYITISEILHLPEIELKDELKQNWLIFDYIRYLKRELNSKCLHNWLFDETFIYIAESNLQSSVKELEQSFELCRKNRIHIILQGFSLTENKYLHIKRETYPGSADDAATYIEYTLIWKDPENEGEDIISKKKARIARGKEIFQQEQRNNPFRQSKPISKILYHEYFTSGHNDSAISISLIDVDGNTLWKTHISDSYEEDACALKAYLADHFRCPVEVIEL